MRLFLLSSAVNRGQILALLVFLLTFSGCSVRRYAINMVGDALASRNSVYENDEDLELVGEALPFGLKLMEKNVPKDEKNAKKVRT